ncbi:MAG TPA: 2Fe-2S iron-sulfur cluster-binding protein, partial [Intrasporangium sp.]|uniref:2Fe-2S iron-sulfur cluster-binding protein n=1 Tax=Intrasporangium sp. TaxID=1925024 RepID=UPI002B48B286
METFTITVEPLGREIECREDQTILDACLRNGVWLPHSCTHGTCATCKCDVVDGDVDHGDASSFALMDFERDEGKLLTCCAKPRSDVVIEADIDVDEDVEVHPVQDYTATVVALDEIARDTRRVVIELDRPMEFNAGQYLKFEVPGKDTDRTYSIANPPTEQRRLEFHIRRTPGGLASDGWIFGSMAIGDDVKVSGPYGRFVLKVGDDRDAVLVAGGT